MSSALSSLSPAPAFSPINTLTKIGNAKANTAKANAADTGTSTSTGGGLTSTTTGSTFLNLLVQELQNQDPTAPMDSTAMVGQMISLNQLDQLISINQVLSTATSASSTTGHSTPAQLSSAQLIAQNAALINGTSNSGQSAQAAQLGASDPNSILDFSSMNIPYGGK